MKKIIFSVLAGCLVCGCAMANDISVKITKPRHCSTSGDTITCYGYKGFTRYIHHSTVNIAINPRNFNKGSEQCTVRLFAYNKKTQIRKDIKATIDLTSIGGDLATGYSHISLKNVSPELSQQIVQPELKLPNNPGNNDANAYYTNGSIVFNIKSFK